jgi:hypothetical protein
MQGLKLLFSPVVEATVAAMEGLIGPIPWGG